MSQNNTLKLRYSGKLQDLARKDPRFDEYEFERDDGHWLYCAPGWIWDNETHFIHEWSVKDVLAEVTNVVRCHCDECKDARAA